MLEAALLLLSEKGRLLPLMIRLADPGADATRAAGLGSAATGRPSVSLDLRGAPTPIEALPPASPHAFARATEARAARRGVDDIGLLEVRSGETGPASGGDIGVALQLDGA